MWSPTRLIPGRTGRAAAAAAAEAEARATPPASLLNSASANPPKWTQQFVGKQMVYFDDQFPNWTGVFADTAGVIAGRDFKTLEAARAAVANLRSQNPGAKNGVVYLKSDEGKFAAYELNKPLQQTGGLWRQKIFPATEVLGRDPRVVLAEDAAGRAVRVRGVTVGTIIT